MNTDMNLVDRIFYAVVLFSIAVIGLGFMVIGLTLLPGFGLIAGFALLFLAYYLWRLQTETRITEIVIKILDLSEEYMGVHTLSGALPVAILSTSRIKGEVTDFDAGTVDTSTLRLDPSGVKPLDPTLLYDIDEDGDVDLVVHFPVSRFETRAGTNEVCIIGATVGGETIRGCTSLERRRPVPGAGAA